MKRLLQLASEEVVKAEHEASAVMWLGPFEALVLCFIWMLPLIVFFIRRNWRPLAERSSRIERLLEPDAEEASRAEAESSIGYTMFSPPDYACPCPICYRPAMYGCSRCNAIGYCSVQCKVVHWYEVHSQQCAPP